MRLYKEGLPVGLDAPDLFYTRSALSILYMAENPSVSGTHGSLYPSAPSVAQPYLTYASLSLQQKAQADQDQDSITFCTTIPHSYRPLEKSLGPRPAFPIYWADERDGRRVAQSALSWRAARACRWLVPMEHVQKPAILCLRARSGQNARERPRYRASNTK